MLAIWTEGESPIYEIEKIKKKKETYILKYSNY